MVEYYCFFYYHKQYLNGVNKARMSERKAVKRRVAGWLSVCCLITLRLVASKGCVTPLTKNGWGERSTIGILSSIPSGIANGPGASPNDGLTRFVTGWEGVKSRVKLGQTPGHTVRHLRVVNSCTNDEQNEEHLGCDWRERKALLSLSK